MKMQDPRDKFFKECSDVVMTLAERYMEKGMEKGLEKGETNALVKTARRRHGDVSFVWHK